MSDSGLSLPPNDTDAEEYVLSVLINQARDDATALDIVAMLKADDFYLLRNGAIYKAIMDVWQSNRYCDSRLVERQMIENGAGSMGDVPDYLLDLSTRFTLAHVAPGHAKTIADAAIRRRVIRAAQDAVKVAYDIEQPISVVQGVASDAMIGACVAHEDNHNVTACEVTDELTMMLEGGLKPGLLTGFRDIDSHLRNGLERGQYWILAGRPAMGKSALALRIARNIASGKSTPDKEPGVVLYITLEMSDKDNQVRLISEGMGLAINDVYNLHRGHELWPKYLQVKDRVRRLPIVYNERAKTIPGIWSAYKRCMMDMGRCDAIFLDRVGLVWHNGDLAGNSNETMTYVSASLLDMSKDVPIVAVSQLNRQVEQRNNKEPMLSDLRMSGSLEQDATAVMMLYREHYYNAEADENAAVAFWRKLRQGPPGKVELFFKSELTAFYDMEWYEKEQK